MNAPFQIQFTATAEATYSEFYKEAANCLAAGDERNPKVTLFRSLEEALTKGIPSDPFNQKNALSGSLSNVFRFSRENVRICYLGHERDPRIIVLYICQSRAEESSSYATFTWMVMSGKFDAAFASLGLNPPDRRALTPSPTVN